MAAKKRKLAVKDDAPAGGDDDPTAAIALGDSDKAKGPKLANAAAQIQVLAEKMSGKMPEDLVPPALAKQVVIAAIKILKTVMSDALIDEAATARSIAVFDLFNTVFMKAVKEIAGTDPTLFGYLMVLTCAQPTSRDKVKSLMTADIDMGDDAMTLEEAKLTLRVHFVGEEPPPPGLARAGSMFGHVQNDIQAIYNQNKQLSARLDRLSELAEVAVAGPTSGNIREI